MAELTPDGTPEDVAEDVEEFALDAPEPAAPTPADPAEAEPHPEPTYLQPAPLPPGGKEQTPWPRTINREVYADLRVRGASRLAALQAAGSKVTCVRNARTVGLRLENDPEVRKLMRDIRLSFIKEAGGERELACEIAWHIAMTEHAAMRTKALDFLARVKGWNAPEKHQLLGPDARPFPADMAAFAAEPDEEDDHADAPRARPALPGRGGSDTGHPADEGAEEGSQGGVEEGPGEVGA